MPKSEIKQISDTIEKLEKKSKELEKIIKSLHSEFKDSSLAVHSYRVIESELATPIKKKIEEMESKLEINKQKIGNLRLYQENIKEINKVRHHLERSPRSPRFKKELNLLVNDNVRIEDRIMRLGLEDLNDLVGIQAEYKRRFASKIQSEYESYVATNFKNIIRDLKDGELSAEKLQSLANKKAEFASKPGDSEIATNLANLAKMLKDADEGILERSSVYPDFSQFKFIPQEDIKTIYDEVKKTNDYNVMQQKREFNIYMKKLSPADFKSQALQFLANRIKEESPNKKFLIGEFEALQRMFNKAEKGELKKKDLELDKFALYASSKDKIKKTLEDINNESKKIREVTINEGRYKLKSRVKFEETKTEEPKPKPEKKTKKPHQEEVEEETTEYSTVIQKK